MSVLDRSFLSTLLVEPPHFPTFDAFETYLRKSFHQLLSIEPVYQYVESGEGSDNTAFALYDWEHYTIVIELWFGSCSGCHRRFSDHERSVEDDYYRELIRTSVDRAYVTTDRQAALDYMRKQLTNRDVDTIPEWI